MMAMLESGPFGTNAHNRAGVSCAIFELEIDMPFSEPFFDAHVFSLHLCLHAFSFTSLGESDLSGRGFFICGSNWINI